MIGTQKIHCPNCGAFATKKVTDYDIQRISCRNCDYLLVQCTKTYRVIEAYAPGIKSYCAVNPVSAYALNFRSS